MRGLDSLSTKRNDYYSTTSTKLEMVANYQNGGVTGDLGGFVDNLEPYELAIVPAVTQPTRCSMDRRLIELAHCCASTAALTSDEYFFDYDVPALKERSCIPRFRMRQYNTWDGVEEFGERSLRHPV